MVLVRDQASPQKPITVRHTHDDSDSDGGSAWKDRAVTLAAECEWMKGRVMELEASVVDKTNELLSVSAQLDATLVSGFLSSPSYFCRHVSPMVLIFRDVLMHLKRTSVSWKPHRARYCQHR